MFQIFLIILLCPLPKVESGLCDENEGFWWKGYTVQAIDDCDILREEMKIQVDRLTNRPNCITRLFLNWPTDDLIVLSRPQPTQSTQVFLFGFADNALNWDFTEEDQEDNISGGYMRIHLPSMAKMQHVRHAWALKITKCL